MNWGDCAGKSGIVNRIRRGVNFEIVVEEEQIFDIMKLY